MTGIEAKEKCVLVVNEKDKTEFLDVLQRRGFLIDKYLKSGQILILDDMKTYLNQGKLLSQRLYELAKQLLDQAMAEGYLGVRFAGESPVVEGLVLTEYELGLDSFVLERENVNMLCHYDETKYDHQDLAKIINTHKKIVIYGNSYVNNKPDNFETEIYQDIFSRLLEGATTE
jgi:S-adenosylmethionine:tRNA-ribosyltransferase-isomerase (queuine synthetase)